MKNGREIAAGVLIKVADGSYNNRALRDALDNSALTRAQRGFVTEIVNGTLRNLILIDHTIDFFSKVKTSDMKPAILAILRSAVYQISYMRTPASAACDEAVKLTHKRGFNGLTGFVNGVLRGVARSIGGMPEPPFNIKYSFPEWITDYWVESHDPLTVEKMCAALNERPDVTLCANTLKTGADALKSYLSEAGNVSAGAYTPNAVHISGISDMTGDKYYSDGFYHVMDESSMRAVEILGPAPGSAVADVCAAPGGKSLYAAELMKNAGSVLACDLYANKLKMIESSAARLGITIIKTAQSDAAAGEYPMSDYMLVDAPCSGLGLLRKKPEIKYRRAPEDIDALAALQKKILANVSKYVKRGGVLLYSTCTVSKRENEDVADWFAENFPFRSNHREIFLPHLGGADGFFIARFIKK